MRDILGIKVVTEDNQAAPVAVVPNEQNSNILLTVAMASLRHGCIEVIRTDVQSRIEKIVKNHEGLSPVYVEAETSSIDVWDEVGADICARFGCLEGHEQAAANEVRSILNGWSVFDILDLTDLTYREQNAPDPYALNAQLSRDEIFIEACQFAGFILWRAIERACSKVYYDHRAE